MSAQLNSAIILIGGTILFLTPFALATEASNALLEEYKKETSVAFSAQSGEQFWYRDYNGRSCTTCHTYSLLVKGRHERTGKIIEPMAPSVNPERLMEVKKVKKWFLRNCKWTIGRECTAREKGDVLLWLSQQ